MKKRMLITTTIVALVLGVFAALYYNHYLNVAHSTFENYAAFRGCTSISNKTDTSAECHLSSGKTITLVKINDKWYLEGDGPGVW